MVDFKDTKGGDIDGQLKNNQKKPEDTQPPEDQTIEEMLETKIVRFQWKTLYYNDIKVIAGLLTEVFYLLDKITDKGVPTEHIFSAEFVRDMLETLEAEETKGDA